MSGKGSAPRPIPDRQAFESNWDAIFGKQKASQPETELENEHGSDKTSRTTDSISA